LISRQYTVLAEGMPDIGFLEQATAFPAKLGSDENF